MRHAAFVVAGLFLAATLAGCLGSEGIDPADDAPDQGRVQVASGPAGDLFGWIFDATFAPLPGVEVALIGSGENTTTNATGYYSFKQLPRGEELFLIADHPAYTPQPKRVLLPHEGSMRLNFTLEPRPIKVPYRDVLEFGGMLSCQAVVEVGDAHLLASARAGSGPGDEERVGVDCGFADPNRADHWEFSVAPNLAGVIIEMVWDATTEFSNALRMTVETTGYGANDAILAEVHGPSVLLAQINQLQAERFYAEGGVVRVSVEVDPHSADQEMGVGVAAAYQQSFQVYATMFYVVPPPATYSYFTD